MPFFVLSSGRSGSTLLSSMLDNHPKMIIPAEQYFLGPMLQRLSIMSFMPWSWKVKMVTKLLSDHAITMEWELDLAKLGNELRLLRPGDRQPENIMDVLIGHYAGVKRLSMHYSLWGESTPETLDHIQRVCKAFPDAKYIGLTRDGRDVVSSLLKLNPKLGVKGSCKIWNQSINNLRWLKSRLGSHQYIQITYEDLVTDHDHTLHQLASFLEVEFLPAMIQYSGYLDRMGKVSVDEAFQEVQLPVNKNNIGKWRKELPSELANQIMPFISNNLKLLGYI